MTTASSPSPWKSPSIVEPQVSVSTTQSGSALSILLTGLEVSLQDPSAPLIATRVAALAVSLAEPAPSSGAREVRHSVRGFTRTGGAASATVVVVAGGRPVVLEPALDDSGNWTAEFAVPLPEGAKGAYTLAVLLVGSRATPDDTVLANVDSLDLELVAAAPPAQNQDDPAAPTSRGERGGRGERGDAAEGEDARAANFGIEAADEDVSFDVGPVSLVLDMSVAQAFRQACTTSAPRVTYGLGAKLPRHDAVPGRDFTKVDCSGFVRELIWRATTPHLNFPDGSVVQHEWVQAHGLPKGTPAEAVAADGVVRIAFLRQQDSPKGIGHVAIIHNGLTLESHGGVGPNSRPWTATGWQEKARVYRLPSE